MSLNSLRRLLPGYNLLPATSASATRRLIRTEPCDLYLVQTPLRWGEPEDVSRTLKSFDPHTPIVLYALEPSDRERREAATAGIHAYVGRADDPHNLQGRVGQLVMLAELRSMEAFATKREALQERVTNRLATLIRTANGDRSVAFGPAQELLKVQAARLFVRAGGTRANFERVWPTLYGAALDTAYEPRLS